MTSARTAAVVAALFVLSASGIAFQLLLAGFAGYLVGESLVLLCAIVGTFLSSMGLGAHLSRRLSDPPADAYIAVGLALAVAGGVAPTAVTVWNSELPGVELVIGAFAAFCGGTLGAAIPLATRLVEGSGALSRLLARVLAVDYAGALLGSLLLPVVVLPAAGHGRGAAALGLAALAASGVCFVALRRSLRYPATVLSLWILGGLAILAAMIHGPRVLDWAFERFSGEEVVLRQHSPYQEILLSEGRHGLSLRLNGQLQFSDAWEKPYHEALVHPAFSLAARAPEEVLVLGGGDGLALREILRYSEVRRIVVVDLDPQMVALARRDARLRQRNRDSFEDRRVELVHEDAFLYVQRPVGAFDVILIDLPQPVSISLSKLYTVEFYRNVASHLRETGMLAVQSEEVEISRGRVLACIHRTIEAAGLRVRPYVTGSLGYNLAAHRPFDPRALTLRVQTEFLTTPMARGLFDIHGEVASAAVEVNRLENHALLGYMP